MRLKDFLIEAKPKMSDVAKKSEAAAQAVWAEKDPEAKFAKAQSFINNMKFKDKIPSNLRTLENMKGNNNKIDKLIGNIQLKGEGQGVV